MLVKRLKQILYLLKPQDYVRERYQDEGFSSVESLISTR